MVEPISSVVNTTVVQIASVAKNDTNLFNFKVLNQNKESNSNVNVKIGMNNLPALAESIMNER